HLFRVTAPGNRVTLYGYGSDPKPPIGAFDDRGAARAHDLIAVARFDGTQSYFRYDGAGRVTATSAGVNGTERVTFTYGLDGSVIVTDATDRQTVLNLGLGGLPAQVRDGEGNITSFDFCSCGKLFGLIGPSGETYRYDYDARDNLTNIHDPLGSDTSFSYE